MSPKATAFLRYIDKTPPALNRLLDTSLAPNVFTDWVNFAINLRKTTKVFQGSSHYWLKVDLSTMVRSMHN